MEVNYPLAISNGFENFTGFANANFKYRFTKGELFNYGASLTFDYLKIPSQFGYQDLDGNYFFYHVDGFAEITIPSAQKIRSQVPPLLRAEGPSFDLYSSSPLLKIRC